MSPAAPDTVQLTAELPCVAMYASVTVARVEPLSAMVVHMFQLIGGAVGVGTGAGVLVVDGSGVVVVVDVDVVVVVDAGVVVDVSDGDVVVRSMSGTGTGST